MPYIQNNNKKINYPVFPSFTNVSISSVEGRDKYVSFDIWNNRTNMTFTERLGENQIDIKLQISLDKIMILHEILYNINGKRINDYRNGTPYSKIEQQIKILVARAFSKKNGEKQEDSPYILIYTKPIENIERVCLKAVDGNKSIEIVLATSNLEIAVSDPNRLANIDLSDIVLSKLVYHLQNLPMMLSIYKMIVAAFQTFIGTIRKDSETGKMYKSDFSNQNYNNNYKKQNTNINTLDNDNYISSDDVPF